MSVDIFVSYAGPDRPWAEWVASQVEAAGLSVELDAWDWAAGSNFVLNMNDALARAKRVVALCSKAYFDRSRYTTEEWASVVATRQRLLPLRVEEVEPPPILRPLVWVDLFGVAEAHARARVRNALLGPKRPSEPVPFPGAAKPAPAGVRLPGSLPSVWNVPPRLRAFTGRKALLAALRERLTSGERTVVQALHGMGGVGKTQLAIEYAHLFAGDYDLVWWIDAERAELIGEQFATLGLRAGWVEPGTADAAALAAVQDHLRAASRWLVIFDNARARRAGGRRRLQPGGVGGTGPAGATGPAGRGCGAAGGGTRRPATGAGPGRRADGGDPDAGGRVPGRAGRARPGGTCRRPATGLPGDAGRIRRAVGPPRAGGRPGRGRAATPLRPPGA